MSENPNVNDPLASSRARDAQLAELKQQAVQVAAGTQASAAGAHRYALDRLAAEAWADFWITLGAHLLPLRKDGTKRPLNNGWPDARAMTRDDVVAWLMRGGGIGVNLGKTGWAVLDADNAKATELFRRAGLVRTVITANAQVPDHPKGKAGGGQFVFRSPEGFDSDALHSRGFELPDGAKGDVLGGRRFIVAAPTRLDEAGGLGYLADPEGIWGTGDPMPRIGPWIADRDADGDYGALEPLKPLRGLLGPKQPHEREYDQDGEWRTVRQQQIDEISWEQVFDCTEGAKFTVDSTDSCGCDVYAYAGQTSKDGRGLTAHDGCSWGWYGRTWSGSAQAHFSLPESTDRLRIAALLRGFEPGGAEEVALGRAWGVEFGGLTSFADELDTLAERYEDFADDPVHCAGTAHVLDSDTPPTVTSFEPQVAATRPDAWRVVPTDREHWIRQAAQCRSVARQLRSGKPAAPQAGGETFLNGPVIGAEVPPQPMTQPADPAEPIDAETVELPSQAEPSTDTAPVGDAVVVDETIAASSSPSTALAVDDAVEGEFVDAWEGGDQEMWTRHRAIEAKLRGERDPDTKLWIGMVPCLGRIANIAESRGVYMLGFTEACLPRVSARVPANVLLTPRADGVREKAEGVGMGYNSILLGPPATGKTTTQTAAAGAIPLLPGIRQCSTGSAEGVIKKARSVSGKGGEEKIHATSVYVETDEIKSQNKDLKRDGSMYSAFINSVFFGGTMVGMTASEASRNADIPAHSTRFAQQIGAQPQLCGLLLDDAGSGITARFSWAFTGSVDESALGPLYGRMVPALLPNGLPWDPPTGIPFGFRPYTGPAASDDEEAVPVHEIENIEALPAEWIVVPRDPEEAAAARAESARRSRRTRVALTEDRESGRTSGHDFVRIEKTAALLAFMDGIKQPTEEYVAAAKLLAEATALAAAEAKAQSDSEDEAKARRGGHLRGIEHLHGNAVAKQEGVDAVEAAADALYAKLTRPPEGVLVKGKLAKGFGGTASYGELTAAKSVRPEHRPFREAGMALLIEQRRIQVAATGSDRREYTVTAVGAAGQLAAAPAIGSLTA